jgi:hypothetical protein
MLFRFSCRSSLKSRSCFDRLVGMKPISYENSRIMYTVFVTEPSESRSVRASFVVGSSFVWSNRSFLDRQQRTANSVHRQIRAQSHRPQCNSHCDLISAIYRLYVPIMSKRANRSTPNTSRNETVSEIDNPAK